MDMLKIPSKEEILAYTIKEHSNGLYYNPDNDIIIEKYKIFRAMDIYLSRALKQLYLECEHGDDKHRQWLKNKFDSFLKRKLDE